MTAENFSKKMEMPKAYDPKQTEGKWYQFWEEKGYFTPQIDPDKKPWVCIMPPPNVTAPLHLGHALFASVEDTFTRWRRMKGDVTLWLPGADHAGISGETVVEKLIWKQEKKTKQELGRDEFLKRVWQWMDETRETIYSQLRALGASADWTRRRFTMDAGPQKAVRFAFKSLFDAGLLYRAERIVNWCPGSLTVISDLEVEMKDEIGSLWYIRYPVKGREGVYVTVATTRPETMLGDTGVAVHPDDPRYKDLIGATLILPLVNREIPLVADDAVESGFGTGAVKVTPGHDQTDFDIGQRQGLPIINIMNPNASINENGGPYAGLDRFAARKQIVADLEAQGYLVKIEENYKHTVPYSERAGVPIEPLVRMQWWVKVEPLAKPALQAALDGSLKFTPEHWGKVYINWLENLHDWPVSRQLYWGHRIPIWYCRNCGKVMSSAEEAEKVTNCEHCGSDDIYQDPDVLDTWFSSGLWPMSTLGWPDKTPDLDYFYPGTLMETGYDIIFLWVARMVMFGLYFMDELPFTTVYFHGTVKDEKGQRMSKSKGNGVDPLEAIDEYGCDALRFTLLTGSTAGVDTKFQKTKMLDSRNFANKIWNATRFITLNLDADLEPATGAPLKLTEGQPLADRWIISRYNQLVTDVNRLMDNNQLGESGRLVYDFLWSEFCDWYIETSKIRLLNGTAEEKRAVQRVLVDVLEGTLRLLHPFMPFVTEELWQNLPHTGESLCIASWPEQAYAPDGEAVRSFEALQEAVKAIRNAKVEAKVEAKRVPAIIATRPETLALFQSERDMLIRLAGVEADTLQISDTLTEAPAQAMALVTDAATVYLPLSGLLDFEQERARLGKEIESAQRDITKSEGMLGNASYIERAPAAIVAKEREKLEASRDRLAKLQERLAALG